LVRVPWQETENAIAQLGAWVVFRLTSGEYGVAPKRASPFRLGNGLIKAIKVRQLGNVSLNTRNVGAHCLHGLIEFLLAAAGDEDKGALFDEKPCRS
jgi:hypothetical protein